MAGTRISKRKGGKAQEQAEAVDGKPEEVAVETASEEAATSDAVTPQEASEAPVEATMESEEGAGAGASEGSPKSDVEKASDDKETPKKGNRRRMRRKGKKPSNADSGPKEKKVVDFDGLIFMCNSETKKDCFKHRVFGFPEGKQNIVEHVKKGMKLFLFDIDKKVLHGVYKASSEGGVNLIEEAFKDSKRKFPAQVRFLIFKDCMPLDENEFKLAIKENYIRRNRFKCELNAEQVGRLMKLFRPLDSRGLPKPKPVKDTRRESSPKGKASRVPPRPQKNRGPPPRFSAPAPPRERFYKDHRPAYPRERQYPESLPPPSYALVPEVSHVEAELLRQRHLRQVQEAQAMEALDRRAYLLDPVVEASVARKRYLEDVYAAEHQALAKRPLLQDSLYRDLEYQREAPAYRTYGEGLPFHAGALHYDPRSSQLGWP